MDSESKCNENVNVAIRIRPTSNGGPRPEGFLTILSRNPAVLFVSEKYQPFTFDNIYEDEDQDQIYNDMVKPLINHVIDGYNSTVFAYGQTGTGKTYTIGTDPETNQGSGTGLITRALEEFTNYSDENREVHVSVSFVEIYNERVYDLLRNSKQPLQLKGFKISGLSQKYVRDYYEAHQLFAEGCKNRRTAETKQNGSSSRSHAIFTINCKVKYMNCETESKLNLVDLAGCESIKKTGNEGAQLAEGININKGLLSIGQVIFALSGSQRFVPYRQSTITMILQDSLNRNNYINFIGCVAPTIEDVHETLQTLEYAQRVKKFKNRPELNNLQLESVKKPSSTRKFKHIVPYTPHKFLKPRSQSATSVPSIVRRPLHSTLANVETANIFETSSISSISSLHEAPVNLSPIVRKCMDTLETNIMGKLQNILKDTMTPVRSSPRFSWNTLQSEVTKIVRSEFKNIEKSNETSRRKNAGNGTCREYVDFVSTVNVSIQNTTPNAMSPVFKAPLPLKRRTRASVANMVKTSSPILDRSLVIKRGRSKRSGLTIQITSPESTQISKQVSITSITETPQMRRRSKRVSHVPQRRSVRISLRQAQADAVVQPVPAPRKNILKSTPVPEPRKRSTRRSARPKTNPVKIDMEHREEILKILNEGSLADLRKLNTVGVKTAAMIDNYRRLIGNFKGIEDLRSVPWRGKEFERFLQLNFLTK